MVIVGPCSYFFCIFFVFSGPTRSGELCNVFFFFFVIRISGLEGF